MTEQRRVLIISENASVPGDRRVWNESLSLTAADWDVSIISPQGQERDTAPFEVRDGIEIHRFPLRPASGGPIGYVREYGQALWRIRRLIRKLALARPFDVVHACNPPDFLLLAARSLRGRAAFVFDHHDLVPELYRSRFGGGTGPLYRVARGLEQVAYRQADVVIATNESYRAVALERGGKSPEDVFVVRNGPRLERFTPSAPDPTLRRGREHLIAYLGIMGPQDGVDHAVRCLGWLSAQRSDWHAIFIGEGDVLEEMRTLAARLGIAERVEFAGWRGDDDIRRILSTADVCLAPDPPSPLNDVSTMIKVTEYMAMGRAVVSYPLGESRISAGDAAVYAETSDPESLGRCVADLLENPDERARLGACARERVERELCWERSEQSLLAAYSRALEHRDSRLRRSLPATAPAAPEHAWTATSRG
jgi:glycosyltransferase involved in cell wall biosynthesis